MKKYKVIRDIKYSFDGFNPTEFKAGEVIELEDEKAKWISQYLEEIKMVEAFENVFDDRKKKIIEEDVIDTPETKKGRGRPPKK